MLFTWSQKRQVLYEIVSNAQLEGQKNQENTKFSCSSRYKYNNKKNVGWKQLAIKNSEDQSILLVDLQNVSSLK